MKKRILVGEDNSDISKVTRVRLEYEGYDVDVAEDGEEVLRRTAGGLFDLILLDIKMPKMNGYDVCRHLKTAPATAAIPVIIFTASEAYWSRLGDRCIEVGASDWIKKPFRTKELMAKIHKVLGEEDASNG